MSKPLDDTETVSLILNGVTLKRGFPRELNLQIYPEFKSQVRYGNQALYVSVHVGLDESLFEEFGVEPGDE